MLLRKCSQHTCTLVNEELDDVEMAVEAGGSERRGVGFCGGVDTGPALHEELDHEEVSGSGGTPQRRRAFYRLSIKPHCKHTDSLTHSYLQSKVITGFSNQFSMHFQENM